MTKRIFKMFLLLALAFGFYAMTAKADAGGAVDSTQTAQATRPAIRTPSVCEVKTGVDNGAVNLRTCAGTSCAVIAILTEGESLNILSAGLWNKVITDDGITGYINSTYCKGK